MTMTRYIMPIKTNSRQCHVGTSIKTIPTPITYQRGHENIKWSLNNSAYVQDISRCSNNTLLVYMLYNGTRPVARMSGFSFLCIALSERMVCIAPRPQVFTVTNWARTWWDNKTEFKIYTMYDYLFISASTGKTVAIFRLVRFKACSSQN